MITLVTLALLAWQFYIGYRRGLFLQGYYVLASLVALVIAGMNYRGLATVLTLWVPYSNPTQGSQQFFFTDVNLFDLDKLYYAGLAFFVSYLVTYLVLRFVGIFIHGLNITRWRQLWSRLLAGVLSIIVTVLGFSMFLTILATVPNEQLQGLLSGDPLARFLIDGVPLFSTYLHQLMQTMV